jgi:hypothetical protein
MKTKIEIKSIFGNVLFEFEKENNTVKDTLIKAVKRNADLRNADLRYAYLGGAYLGCADLRNADLRNADLRNADLGGAYLRNADLRNADLRNADLRNADLRNADLGGAYLRNADLGEWGKLQSSSDILIVGTIGSRNGYTTIFHTDKGVFVMCGCFKGTLDEFEVKVKETHQGNKHERDYLALIQFAKIKFEL